MDMDMDMSSSSACTMNMLWHWSTINSCFIASSWHVTSNGGFVGTCIGTVFLGMAVELVRRLEREYDRFLVAQHRRRLQKQQAQDQQWEEQDKVLAEKSQQQQEYYYTTSPTESTLRSSTGAGRVLTRRHFAPAAGAAHHGSRRVLDSPYGFTPSMGQQAVRSLFYVLQYGGAYFLMLLVMAYNGYVIICVLAGGFLGHWAFASDGFRGVGTASGGGTVIGAGEGGILGEGEVEVEGLAFAGERKQIEKCC